MTDRQEAALLECAEALKDIINAADNGDPYTPNELKGFEVHLSELHASGVLLRGE